MAFDDSTDVGQAPGRAVPREQSPFSGDSGEYPGATNETGTDYPATAHPDDEDIYGEDDPFPEDEEPYVQPDPGEEEGDAPPSVEVEDTKLGRVIADLDDDESDDENATRTGPPIHLEVISGPDQGRTRRFRGVRMVIGRIQGCDFKLIDDSVSRRHLELILGDDGVLLRDLGSGNGTRVNGDKVTESKLQDGDEIAIGKTRFRFVDELAAMRRKEAEARAAEEKAAAEQQAVPAQPAAEGAEPPASSEPGPRDVTHTGIPVPTSRRAGRSPAGAGRWGRALDSKRKRLIAIGGAAVVLLLAIGLVLARPSPPPEPDPRIAEAAAKLQYARNAFRQEKFEEAIALLDEAKKLSPAIDDNGLSAAAHKELATWRGFEEVRALLRAGRFDEARARLAQVPLATVLGEDARKKLEAELANAGTVDLRARAEAALEAGDLSSAEALVGRLPRELATALQPKLETLRQKLAEEEAAAARAEAKAAAARRKAAAEKRQDFIDAAFENVARKFHAGEFQRAALECDRVVAAHGSDTDIRERARNLKVWIPQFGRALDEGTRKFNQGNMAGAARPLRKARELYRQIGFEGALGSLLDEQLASASLEAARSALARNDLASAASHYREAKALNPNDVRGQQGLDIVYRKAEELYLDAYMIRDREPRAAAEKFRTVMDVLPRTSETWGRAKNVLDNLTAP
ncbi:MAG: FHA domain-containing protein [Myxococcaceae bacterium]